MIGALDLLAALVVAPFLLSFLALGGAWLAGARPSERVVVAVTAAASALSTAAAIALAAIVTRAGLPAQVVPFGAGLGAGDHGVPIRLIFDRTNLPFVVMSPALVGTVGFFSARYLHRERGHLRFFLLLHLFGAGMILIFAAETLHLLIAGWELAGISSVLLIAFFQKRPAPVANALHVFVVYRTCDLGLLTAALLLHHFTGSAEVVAISAAPLTPGEATAVGLLLLWAAMGKSAQVPLSGWLPRAMEGPTPSSAIFYGAFSIHAGAFLLLRFSAVISQTPAAAGAVVLVGAASALHGTLVGRVQPDAKSTLAYASTAQVGIIFVEIGLGLSTLAQIHVVGHAAVRTLQLLRAPSMLHDYHRLAPGLSPTGLHYEVLLPVRLRRWLYRLALMRGYHDELAARLVVRPVLGLARWLDALGQGWIDPGPRTAPARGSEPARAPEPALAEESRSVNG